MANSNQDALIPEFWAASFDEYDRGEFPLINMVDRKYEELLGTKGDIVHVPVSPDAVASDFTPGSAITVADKAQTLKAVELNVSKNHTFTLTTKDLSMNPYNLIETYGVPAIEALRAEADLAVYKQLLASQYFSNGLVTFNEDNIIDMRTALKNRKVKKPMLVLSPDEVGKLLKIDPMQFANQSGDGGRAMREGQLDRKFGMDVFEANGIDTYTPSDLVGAINGALSGGETAIVVNGFADSAAPVREGDIVVLAGETGTPYHTVTAVTKTAGVTTGMSIYPAVSGAVADTTAVTVTPSRSAIAFSKNAVAFAARPYSELPEGAGVKSTVIYDQGLPIRISIWHDGKLGINVQYDILCGAALIDPRRVHRAVTV